MKTKLIMMSLATLLLGGLLGASFNASALDTVVVGRSYYGYPGPYFYGGFAPGPYFAPFAGGYGYYPLNPALQGQAIGSNPYFLGGQMAINRGNVSQVQNALQRTGTVLFTPNPVDYGSGYNYGGYPYYPY